MRQLPSRRAGIDGGHVRALHGRSRQRLQRPPRPRRARLRRLRLSVRAGRRTRCGLCRRQPSGRRRILWAPRRSAVGVRCGVCGGVGGAGSEAAASAAGGTGGCGQEARRDLGRANVRRPEQPQAAACRGARRSRGQASAGGRSEPCDERRVAEQPSVATDDTRGACGRDGPGYEGDLALAVLREQDQRRLQQRCDRQHTAGARRLRCVEGGESGERRDCGVSARRLLDA
mmetsp:Transcript_46602/g.93282  ORF Transcript_46602/g.93282 Transcript_46602/m.93282 type:complete len:230 (+) Transcript_46602:2262-2951(+)